MTQSTPTPPPAKLMRDLFLASAAGVALIAAASATGMTELAPWTARASAATTELVAGPVGFADLIAKVEPAVVSIRVIMQAEPAALTTGPGGRTAMAEGAGFFISADGTIVTANHVVANARSVEIVTGDGTTFAAKVVGTDPGTDVAVLKVDAGRSFAYVKFADQPPRVGDWAVAIGTPFGLAATATVGIVSALARDIGDRSVAGYLQIDAPINEGNSGGPTFDVHGNVIGINDSIFSPSGGGSVGIGFDIPADVAKSAVAELQKSGRVNHAWLGVQVQSLTEEIAAGLGLAKGMTGALVADAQAGSPAAQAGLAPGDVITAINGTPVKDSRGLAQAIAGLAPGTSAKVAVTSHGQNRTIDVRLGEQPAPRT